MRITAALPCDDQRVFQLARITDQQFLPAEGVGRLIWVHEGPPESLVVVTRPCVTAERRTVYETNLVNGRGPIYIAAESVELQRQSRVRPRRMTAAAWFKSSLSAPETSLARVRLRVGENGGKARLNLRSHWFEQCGFPVGAIVRPELIEPGVLLLRALPAEGA